MNNIKQLGVGLIEVLIALIVLSVGALSVGLMIKDSHLSLFYSSNHFDIDSLSQEMLENIRANSAAARGGLYNTLYAAAVPSGIDTPVAKSIDLWKARVAELLPQGAGQIECDADTCVVSMRWRESVDGNSAMQFYQLNTPI